MGGIVATDVRMAVTGSGLKGYTAIAGLGGRSIPKSSLHTLFRQAEEEVLPPVTFLDLDWDAVNKQLDRERQTRRSGPIAENMLHDKGIVSARFG
jgi:pyruvate ferredoxin oxidoreductase alpha subunit